MRNCARKAQALLFNFALIGASAIHAQHRTGGFSVFIPVWLTARVSDASVGGRRGARHVDIAGDVDWMTRSSSCAHRLARHVMQQETRFTQAVHNIYAGNTELILPYCVLVLDEGKCHSINTITPHTENVQISRTSATLLTTLLNIISLLLAKYLRVALQTEAISIIISL